MPRDAQKFRDFVQSTYNSKDREDPFTHFYLKEARNGVAADKQLADEKERQQLTEEGSADVRLLERGEERRQALSEKLEETLMHAEMRDNDLLDMSSQLKSRVNVKVNLGTLMKSEFIYDVDPELEDASLSPEDYLELFRKRAEAKLIKTKIIYKLYNSEGQLTPNEKQYLKQWVAEIQKGKATNLLNLRDTMLPKAASKLTIGDIDAKSLYALNSINHVGLERDAHGAFALNDLVVELSHFLDEEVVNKVETELFSDKLKAEWGLSKDFKVVETRNKEIGLVLNELEEVAWRSAGQFEEKDFENLKAMVSVRRDKDYFDKQFYENDMASFKEFMAAANSYDDRVALVERWLIRKEDEYKARVQLPPAALKKTDQALHQLIDASQKQARESLAAKLLIADEHGNPIGTDKKYEELTAKELRSLTENLCLRMYLFNYDYPAFLPQVVRAVIEHPQVQRSDRDQLELYARLFELDWRGDRDFKNKQEFMATHPIYLDGANLKSQGAVTDEVVKERLQRACAPYVEETAKRISQAASQ